MNGIQHFVGGGGAFGNRSVSRQKSSLARNTRKYTPPSKDDSNQNRNYKSSSSSSSSSNGIQSLDSNKDRNYETTGNNFISDLKKSSQFLYSQHPYAQEMKKKYNLSDQDIINLRIGMNQPGHSNKIKDVYQKSVLPSIQNNYIQSLGFKGNVEDGFAEGMKMSDLYKDPNSNYFANNIQSMPFLLGANSLFGSPRGQQGYYFAQNEYNMSGEEAKNFAASIANNPELYNQMMQSPTMKQYAVDQYAYDVQRTNPMGKDNGILDLPAVEPAPYDFVRDNPFFN